MTDGQKQENFSDFGIVLCVLYTSHNHPEVFMIF